MSSSCCFHWCVPELWSLKPDHWYTCRSLFHAYNPLSGMLAHLALVGTRNFLNMGIWVFACALMFLQPLHMLFTFVCSSCWDTFNMSKEHAIANNIIFIVKGSSSNATRAPPPPDSPNFNYQTTPITPPNILLEHFWLENWVCMLLWELQLLTRTSTSYECAGMFWGTPKMLVHLETFSCWVCYSCLCRETGNMKVLDCMQQLSLSSLWFPLEATWGIFTNVFRLLGEEVLWEHNREFEWDHCAKLARCERDREEGRWQARPRLEQNAHVNHYLCLQLEHQMVPHPCSFPYPLWTDLEVPSEADHHMKCVLPLHPSKV